MGALPPVNGRLFGRGGATPPPEYLQIQEGFLRGWAARVAGAM